MALSSFHSLHSGSGLTMIVVGNWNLFVLGIALSWTVGAATLPRERMEEFLLHAGVRVEAAGPASVPNSKTITFLDGDTSHLALVRMLPSPNDPARFAIAAYRLDKL